MPGKTPPAHAVIPDQASRIVPGIRASLLSNRPWLARSIRRSSAILGALLLVAGCSADPVPPPADHDLLGVLKTRPSLSRFTEALMSTGIAASFDKAGSYTIVAPVDAAVDRALDQATIRHHILLGRVTFADVAGETVRYRTLHGDAIEIDATGAIRVEGALMVASDITADNGVIHVIDKVLTPGVAPVKPPPGVPPDLVPPHAEAGGNQAGRR
jgi:hypothetical protein